MSLTLAGKGSIPTPVFVREQSSWFMLLGIIVVVVPIASALFQGVIAK